MRLKIILTTVFVLLSIIKLDASDKTDKTYEKLLEKGVILLQQNKLIEAIDAFNEAVTFAPKRFEGYHYLGNAYLQGGLTFSKIDIKRSIEYLKKAIEIKSEFSDSYYLMGIAYLNMWELDKAEESFQTAYKLSPQSLVGKLSLKKIEKIRTASSYLCLPN